MNRLAAVAGQSRHVEADPKPCALRLTQQIMLGMAKVREVEPVATEVQRRLEGLIAILGNNRVASLLDVSRSQPVRWRRGDEGLSPESQGLVVDLDYVVTKFRQVYADPEVLWIWLNSQNPILGARPIDAIMQRGPSVVLPAIDSLSQSAFV